MKKIAILLISSASAPLAERVRNILPGAEIYSKEAKDDFLPVPSFEETAARLFPEYDALVFIGAMGICVRSIAPLIQSKYTDPAVVCIDSTGKFVIPVLSGHIGGANDLSREIASALDAEAVITTQSDNIHLWALDTFSRLYGWRTAVLVTGMEEEPEAKQMNACIIDFVNRRPTALLLDVRDRGTDYLEQSCPAHVKIFYRFEEIDPAQFELLIAVTPRLYETTLPVLTFTPACLHLGIGCRKGLEGDAGMLYDQIAAALRAHRLNPWAIADLNTIDIKESEPLLNRLAAEVMHVPLHAYPAEVLKEIEVPNPSARVEAVTQSPSVSEAAAIRGADGGPLLVEKQKGMLHETGNDYTFAVALDQTACRAGHIEIVGAGPGDPELISLRGRRMLERADLILYAGSLVPKALTECAKPGATVRSSADLTLEEQFRLMKTFYDRGLFIVRLHTGDPCIYGAIEEQMSYFDQYGMDYHITPGISSFQAAAAALRSQFTIPEKVQTIILTRGEGRTPMPEREQLHKLAQSQSTMCIYLSASIVDQVQAELLQAYPPTTPVAACYKLTWKEERIYRGELKDLAKIVKENKLTLTTLIVVGEAIGNRSGQSRLYAANFSHLFRQQS